MNPYEVIKRGVVTEKATTLEANLNQYTIAVDPRATKTDVKSAIEKLFKVKVKSVNTIRCAGKARRVGMRSGRTAQWKKVYITLKEGEKLELVKE